MPKTTENDLGSLFDDFVELLHDVVKNGEKVVVGEAVETVTPKPATLAVIRQLLKDNGIEAARGKSNKLGKLADSLPTFPEDEAGEAGPLN